MTADLAARRRLRPGRTGRIVRNVVLVIVSAAFVIPLVWMALTALKTSDQVFTSPPVVIPDPPVWSNFGDALFGYQFGRYLLNTLVLSVVVAAGNLLSASLTAYGLAIVEWRHRNLAFVLVLSTLLLPDFVTLIPLYGLFRELGMVGGLPGTLPLILPAFFGKAYYIFLLRQFMLGLPKELPDAARIDGASELGILVRIVLPLCRPALLSLTLYSFVYTWSDFLLPLVYLKDQSLYTVSVGLAEFQGRYQTQWPQMMAAAAVAVVPILIVFVLAQRAFVRGATTSGLK